MNNCCNISNEDNKFKNNLKQENQCMKCNKKLKLTAIQCKCGNYYCNAHQYYNCHDCKFNYKDFGKKLLEKTNQIILGKKIDKFNK